MKWIKTAIGAVIAVLSIGIIATTVFKMTQPEVVIREVSVEIDPVEGKYYPTSAYNKILEYGVIDGAFIINVVSGYLNNEFAIVDLNIEIGKVNETDVIYIWGCISSPDNVIIVSSYIDAEGNWFDNDSDLTDNVSIKLVFEVPQYQFTGTTTTLILLIPLVFVGGVLLYFYKPLKKE